MRVLFIYLYCTKGGVETCLKNRLDCLDSNNLSVDLLFFHDFGGAELFDNINCNVIIENDNNKIKQMIFNNKYDVIISIDTPAAIKLINSINYKGFRILEVHTTYKESLDYLIDLKENDIDKIVVPSMYEKNLVKELIHFNANIEIIPNGIDLSIFNLKDVNIEYNYPILLWVGRLDEHKNWELFLNIANELMLKYNKKIQFWVVGGLSSEKSQIDKFNKKINESNLYKCVKWFPKIDYSKMSYIYSCVAKSKGAYICTSKNESFGMTVIEAMACKCAVICNKVGALSELVKDSTCGLIIDMNNRSVKDINCEIYNFVSNDSVRTKCIENAHLNIASNYSNKIICNNFAEMLKNLEIK